MKDVKDKAIEALLMTMTYDDMTPTQMKAVVEYEVSMWKGRVDEYLIAHSIRETEEMIHGLWLDYEIADETEDTLLKYIGSNLMITI